MANSNSEKTKKIRSQNAVEWTKITKRFEVKLKPSDSKYINIINDLNQKNNIDKLKFLIDFYQKNK
jgi:hypothetical protein